MLDPFQAGLEPQEVELRFRALRNQFDEFAGVAPDALADDLDRLVQGLGELAEVLDASGYDFAEAALLDELAFVDDPVFADIGVRLAAYQEQVCA